jgi:hypothetical protein
MGAGIYHIKMDQGSTFSLVLTYKDSGGNVIDLSGYTARMQMRRNHQDDSLIDLTTENGRIALGGVAGTVTLTIAATDTAALPPVEGVYDLEIVSGAVVDKLLAGTFSIAREVTR